MNCLPEVGNSLTGAPVPAHSSALGGPLAAVWKTVLEDSHRGLLQFHVPALG